MFRRAQALAAWLGGTSVFRNRFYVAGLAVQKGTPVIAVPLLVGIFGLTNYAEYVLFYTIVQSYANVVSLGVPQAVVPLWFKQADQAEFTASVVGLVLLLWLIWLVPGVPLLLLLTHRQPGAALDAWSFVLSVVLFAAAWNLNTLAVAMTRVKGRQRVYFAAALAGALVLVVLALAARSLGLATLQALVALQGLAVLTSATVMIGTDARQWASASWRGALRHGRALLGQGAPICAYAFISLYSMSVDKWLVRIWFPTDVFNAYVLDSQFAFAILVVPAAIALQVGPRFAELIAQGDRAGLQRLERRAARLTVGASLLLAFAILAYATLTGLKLTWGFGILVAAYLFEGQFMLASNRLVSEMRSGSLVWVGCIGALLLTAGLLAACLSGHAAWVYFACLAYYAAMFAMARWRVLRLSAEQGS